MVGTLRQEPLLCITIALPCNVLHRLDKTRQDTTTIMIGIRSYRQCCFMNVVHRRHVVATVFAPLDLT